MTKTRESLSIALALTFFGAMLLMPEPAQAQNCAKKPDHPKCVGVGTEYTVSLTGAFVFDEDDGPMEVTIKVRGNDAGARSDQPVNMTRPSEIPGDFFQAQLRATWDAVWDACPERFRNPVESIFVGRDDWRISFVREINEIHLVLGDISAIDAGGNNPNTDVFLQLRGDADYDNDPIPPRDSGQPSVFTLDRFVISVPLHKKKKATPCWPPGSGPGAGVLIPPSTLSITAPPEAP